jgi:hypothetical protein
VTVFDALRATAAATNALDRETDIAKVQDGSGTPALQRLESTIGAK